ncbi:hypothetical protein [Brevundimonas sp.]|uniref:hypothetical protein n=1 Tax=Brevundimonas sp. TaxID=1871086 RepID=UPI0035B3A841
MSRLPGPAALLALIGLGACASSPEAVTEGPVRHAFVSGQPPRVAAACVAQALDGLRSGLDPRPLRPQVSEIYGRFRVGLGSEDDFVAIGPTYPVGSRVEVRGGPPDPDVIRRLDSCRAR